MGYQKKMLIEERRNKSKPKDFDVIILGEEKTILCMKFFDCTYLPEKEYYINIDLTTLSKDNPSIEMIKRDSGVSKFL